MNVGDMPEDRDGFRFRGGCNAIDLPATLQARLSGSPRELLNSPDDLARWLVSAGLAGKPPKTTPKDLATVRALREAIYVLAGGRRGAEADAARKTLNRVASGAAAVPLLQADGSMCLEGTASALIVTLAREAVQLFSDAVDLIRQCQSPTCTIYFVDTSRRGDRRWCSMLACGNKAKVREFRKRQRES
ncbi:CGNR zinc finger domain-containing protein [Bradyrhizobium sp.]|uniref:CGNR zinc finger domain-containing protein n=1 Tax=Bradyrhizobium sp. TaxID=376 RepID=UPI002D5659EC|nr:ABATE domain-containing protein [Bradyrhizobium sp.]HZR76956.1 ABATE domain-containing protein [Bradyrhizobium sp.]